MDIGIHRVTKVELTNIREYDDYETRDIIIHSEDGNVTVTLYSVRGDNTEGILKVQA